MIRGVVNNNQIQVPTIDKIKIEGRLTNDVNLIVNKFNEYFINIGPNLAKQIPAVSGKHLDYMTETKFSDSFYARPTDECEIIDIVNGLKANTSPGYDEVSPKIIKLVIPLIVSPLTTIFNKSLVNGIFPSKLKTAKVCPIYKGDDKHELCNYRPISVLPIFSKILEKIMCKRLLLYLEANGILTNRQYGFREAHSTCLAIMDLIDEISEALDNKEVAVGVFMDLSKAFDTLNHDILLDKLNIYGIRGTMNDWFRSYLRNRKQFVQIGQTKSSLQPICCGVPQGSILGPILFILYINDVVNASRLANTVMFADDTNLFFCGHDMDLLVVRVNEEVKKVSHWFKLNKLSLNIRKTNYMVFHTRNKKVAKHGNVLIDNIQLNHVTKTKFLGVILDESLSWKDHIATVKKKVAKSVGILHRLKKILPLSILVTLYKSLIHPYLEYCNILWAIDKTVVLNELLRLQKKAIRIITNSPWKCNTVALFKRLYILPLFTLNSLQLGCFMYRCVNDLIPTKFRSMFIRNDLVHSHNTRNKSKLHMPSHRLKLRATTVRVAGVMFWNGLSPEIQTLSPLFRFKNKLKKELFDNITLTK